jgi:hypothetical protein
MATNTNRWPLEEAGCTWPTKSKAHPQNSHGLIIGCNMATGANCTSLNI